MEKILTSCVKMKQYEEHCSILADTHSSVLKLNKDMTSANIMSDRFSDSLMNVNSRISGIESSLSRKIDKSDVNHLEGLVSKLQMFDDFKEKTLTSLKELGNFQTNSLQEFSKISEKHQILDMELDNVNKEIMKTLPKREARILAKEIENHAALLGNFADII